MPQTLLDHLLGLYPQAKRTTLRRMLQEGRVTVGGRRAISLKQEVADGDQVAVKQARNKPQLQEEKLPFPVVYEDKDILIIDKPAGLITSTTPREKRPTALAMVRQYVMSREPKSQVGLIHRLDADASGLLVFSKNHDAYLSLKEQFFQHSVERIYVAVVDGVPTPREGTIDSRLVERADGTVHSTVQPGKGQRAITHYQTIRTVQGRSFLRVRLQTGRKHQIRCHLAERGVPIVNDALYNRKRTTGRLMLGAAELTLQQPRTGKTLSFRIEIPTITI